MIRFKSQNSDMTLLILKTSIAITAYFFNFGFGVCSAPNSNQSYEIKITRAIQVYPTLKKKPTNYLFAEGSK
jgi:hypothetical protein